MVSQYQDSIDSFAGHSGEVFSTRFDPTAQHIASGSMDRSICTLLYGDPRGVSDKLQCFGIHTDNVKTTEFFQAIEGRFWTYTGRAIPGLYFPLRPI
jgi:WD40 repeat protein